ncbi:MAG: hemolysin family protein [Clostridiales bacterium]|nr:hemolysin family protein [Clostridiales bacterium]
MAAEFWKWTGLGLVFLGAFALSLFHASLGTFSKISLSRFLEDKEKEVRQGLLDRYDETKIAVESLRVIFLIAFLVYLLTLLPKKRLWPLGFFFLALVIYFVFFDYVPRLLNSLDKKAVLGFFLPSFRCVQTLAAPLIFLVHRLEKEQIEEELREASEEEIETFIDEATEEGIIEEDEGVLLRSVVEFGDTLVREIMTPRVEMVCIRKDATLGALRDLILKEKYSRLPVYKDRIDNIEGMVIAKDLLQYSDDRYREMPIEPIIRPAYFIPESMKVAELLREFQKRKLKMALVVDEHGGVSGLVTMEDLMEEIVGEIQDEYDTEEEAEITPSGPGEFIVRGDVEVKSIENLFDLDLAEDDYITVSGLVTHDLGRLPKRSETFETKGLAFEILDVDQKRIKKIKVRKTKKPGHEEEGEKR